MCAKGLCRINVSLQLKFFGEQPAWTGIAQSPESLEIGRAIENALVSRRESAQLMSNSPNAIVVVDVCLPPIEIINCLGKHYVRSGALQGRYWSRFWMFPTELGEFVNEIDNL